MARISSGTLPVYLEFVCNTGVLKEDADRGLARTHEQTLEGMIMLSGWQSPNKENRAAKEGMKHSPLTVVRNFWPGSETSPRGPLLLLSHHQAATEVLGSVVQRHEQGKAVEGAAEGARL